LERPNPPNDSRTPPLNSQLPPVTQGSPAASSSSAAASSSSAAASSSSAAASSSSAAASSSSAAASSPTPNVNLGSNVFSPAGAASSMSSIPNDIDIKMLFDNSIVDLAIYDFNSVASYNSNYQKFINHIKSDSVIINYIYRNTQDYSDDTLDLDDMQVDLTGTFTSRDGLIQVASGKLVYAYNPTKFVYLYNDKPGEYFSLYVLRSLLF
jgi:hypothetical protein